MMPLTAAQMLAEARRNVPEISAAEAKERLDRGEVDLIVDVREAGEWEKGHIPGAAHVPRGFLEWMADPTSPTANRRLTGDVEQRIVVHCGGGARSLLAAATLKRMGYANVASMAGGLTDWSRQGFPIE